METYPTRSSPSKTNLLMDLTLMLKPKVCVEIGAFTGSSILPVATVLKRLDKGKIVAIDAWSTNVVIERMDDIDPNKAWWSTVNMDDVHRSFLSMLQQWSLENFCEVIREPSKTAIKKVKDIDLLHIDGDSSEKGSLQDVSLYFPKVKKGGYILFSNLFYRVNGGMPRMKAFHTILKSCDFICEIDSYNTVLLRKR